MKLFVRLIIILIFLSIAIALAGWFYFKHELNSKAEYNEPLKFEIVKGTSIRGALRLLNTKGVLKPYSFYKYYLSYYAGLNNKQLYAGLYRIDTGKTNLEIIDALFDDSNLWTVKVTFPEGYSYKKYAEIASSKIITDKKEFLRLCRSDSLLKARNIKANSIEGYLMPDTYEFFAEVAPARIIDRMLDNHFKFISTLKSVTDSIDLTQHQVLTLASIIEAETPVAEEKPIVSGLYRNRLKIGMMLQADPTVQYAIGEKRRILYNDLQMIHPYNTYKISGLPPGPINNPGKESIKAAFFPEEHKYLYMVAVGDGSGKHNFGVNFSEHQKNIRIFRNNTR